MNTGCIKVFTEMIYVAIIRGDKKSGRVELCTSQKRLSEVTGIPVSVFSYQFGRKKRDYYEHLDPWVEVFVTDKVHRVSRPQYNRHR